MTAMFYMHVDFYKIDMSEAMRSEESRTSKANSKQLLMKLHVHSLKLRLGTGSKFLCRFEEEGAVLVHGRTREKQ